VAPHAIINSLHAYTDIPISVW